MPETILRRDERPAQLHAERKHEALLPDDWQEDDLADEIEAEVWLRRLYDSTRPEVRDVE